MSLGICRRLEGSYCLHLGNVGSYVSHDTASGQRIFQVNPEVQETVKSEEKNEDYATLPVYEASTVGHDGSAGNSLDSCARERPGRETVYPERFPRYFPLLPDKFWNGIYQWRTQEFCSGAGGFNIFS